MTTRDMCEGCTKALEDAEKYVGRVCTCFYFKPSIYVRANECPMNPIQRKETKGKVRVGQQKKGKSKNE